MHRTARRRSALAVAIAAIAVAVLGLIGLDLDPAAVRAVLGAAIELLNGAKAVP